MCLDERHSSYVGEEATIAFKCFKKSWWFNRLKGWLYGGGIFGFKPGKVYKAKKSFLHGDPWYSWNYFPAFHAYVRPNEAFSLAEDEDMDVYKVKLEGGIHVETYLNAPYKIAGKRMTILEKLEPEC